MAKMAITTEQVRSETVWEGKTIIKVYLDHVALRIKWEPGHSGIKR